MTIVAPCLLKSMHIISIHLTDCRQFKAKISIISYALALASELSCVKTIVEAPAESTFDKEYWAILVYKDTPLLRNVNYVSRGVFYFQNNYVLGGKNQLKEIIRI